MRLQTGDCCCPRNCATKLSKKITCEDVFSRHWQIKSMSSYSASLFFSFLSSLFHSFFSRDVQASRPSPTLSPPILTSHFLFPPVNINTKLMCPPVRMSALEKVSSHIVWRSDPLLFTCNPEAFSRAFDAHENDGQPLWWFPLPEWKRAVTWNHFWLELLPTEIWVIAFTWRIAASYVRYGKRRDVSLSMNSLWMWVISA